MPPNEMEYGENKMFAQSHRARKLKASDARGPVTAITLCILLAEFCFALISVVLHKIPETCMQGRGKEKHQDVLLLAGTLTPNLSVKL